MQSTGIDRDLRIREALERGHADHGWLESYHTFSFADYYDPRYMGFRSLRVINEDRVAPGKGFSSHPHDNMEIFSYVVEGAIAHKDSMGHQSLIKAGQVQKITAGRGILHSEFNASDRQRLHFYQIWILPDKKGLTPSYQEATLPQASGGSSVTLIGAPQGNDALVNFYQDVYVWRVMLAKGYPFRHMLKTGRGLWIQMVKGRVELNDSTLAAGDGASLEVPGEVRIKSLEESEFLLFDLK